MSESRFQIIYDGPAVSEGSIDVAVLAPALMSVGELVRASNESLNGPASEVTVKVESGFKRGSFVVDLVLSQDVQNTAAVLISGYTALQGDQLVKAIFGGVEKAKDLISGVMGVYKAVRGEKPKDSRPDLGNKNVILVFGNNNQITTDQNSGRLYLNDNVRRSLAGASAPLTHAGITDLRVQQNNEVLDSLHAGDLPSGVQDATLELPSPQGGRTAPRELLVRVVKPNFDGGRWSFSDGAAKFGADLEDKIFQERVNRREVGFFQGDTLRILLRTEQHIDQNNRLITTNVVEKVLEYKAGVQQLLLSDSESSGH